METALALCCKVIATEVTECWTYWSVREREEKEKEDVRET